MSDRFGSRRLGWVLLLTTGALVVGGIIAYRHFNLPSPATLGSTSQTAGDDPRRTFDTPFENVRPDVAYVGDAACIECHRDIAKSYAKHPMGRAMAPTGGKAPAEPLGTPAHNPFEKFGNNYAVEMRDGKMFHREERRDAEDKVAAATECEAKYAIGSGTRGKSYLVEIEGRLFQSPISWFSEKKIWDLSPGFNEDRHFTRVIVPKCLFCHCNKAEHVKGTLNTYRAPAFAGFAIGCERCHGPGERHVKLRESNAEVTKPDYSIVNPRVLQPLLRDSVCEQCHLQGEQRIFRRDRDIFDFRPGMPLDLFVSVHVKPPGESSSFRSVGQIEQVRISRCHQGSGGALGCISCHDPHRRPEASERVAYYRDKCLSCHADKGCSLPTSERLKLRADDSCVECHMSKDGSRNIPHTAVTDHRILRRPDLTPPSPPKPLRPDELPFVNYHRDRPGFADPERDRDTGVALIEMMRQGRVSQPELARLADPLLAAAVRGRPDDAEAWAARGIGFSSLNRTAEALDSFEKALAILPNHETSLVQCAVLQTASGKADAAIGFWKRAIGVNPALPHYHMELARLHALRSEWSQARLACDRVLKLAPITIDARILRVTCLVRQGEKKQAQQEIDTIFAMRPANEVELRRVFDGLMK